jgi:hypothetical protein
VAVGSIAIGAWIARLVLAILLVHAVVEGRYRVAVVTFGLAVAGWVVLARVNGYLVTPFLAVLDIALVLVVFGRDIRIG